MTEADIWQQQWYYKIEVQPGLLTNGYGFPSIAAVRELFAKIPVEGLRCLDLCAMEGLITLLGERRGGRCTAWDRLPDGSNATPERLHALRRVLGATLDFVRHARLSDFRPTPEMPRFDVVVFAGVLYHVFDPFATLLQARNWVRDGGLLLLETACARDTSPTMTFNVGGCFYPDPAHGNYWFPSPACLDVMLRCARLRPLDAAWIDGKVPRVAVVCRAEAEPPQTAIPDNWLAGQATTTGAVALNYAEHVDWAGCASTAAPVAYATRKTPPALQQMVERTDPLKDAVIQQRSVLYLSDKR